MIQEEVVWGVDVNESCIVGMETGKFLMILGILVGLSLISVNLPCTAIDLPSNLVVGLELDDKGINLRNMIFKHLRLQIWCYARRSFLLLFCDKKRKKNFVVYIQLCGLVCEFLDCEPDVYFWTLTLSVFFSLKFSAYMRIDILNILQMNMSFRNFSRFEFRTLLCHNPNFTNQNIFHSYLQAIASIYFTNLVKKNHTLLWICTLTVGSTEVITFRFKTWLIIIPLSFLLYFLALKLQFNTSNAKAFESYFLPIFFQHNHVVQFQMPWMTFHLLFLIYVFYWYHQSNLKTHLIVSKIISIIIIVIIMISFCFKLIHYMNISNIIKKWSTIWYKAAQCFQKSTFFSTHQKSWFSKKWLSADILYMFRKLLIDTQKPNLSLSSFVVGEILLPNVLSAFIFKVCIWDAYA